MCRPVGPDSGARIDRLRSREPTRERPEGVRSVSMVGSCRTVLIPASVVRLGRQGGHDGHNNCRACPLPRSVRHPRTRSRRRVSRRLHRNNQSQLHHRLAPVRTLVRRSRGTAPRRQARTHRAVRPPDGSRRQDAFHRGATHLDAGQLLPLLPCRRTARTQSCGERAPPQGRLRVPHPWVGPQRARRPPGPGRARNGPRQTTP